MRDEVAKAGLQNAKFPLAAKATPTPEEQPQLPASLRLDTLRPLLAARFADPEIQTVTAEDGQQFIGPVTAVCSALFGEAITASNAVAKVGPASDRLHFDDGEGDLRRAIDARTNPKVTALLSVEQLEKLMHLNARYIVPSVLDAMYINTGSSAAAAIVNPLYRSSKVSAWPGLKDVARSLMTLCDRQAEVASAVPLVDGPEKAKKKKRAADETVAVVGKKRRKLKEVRRSVLLATEGELTDLFSPF